MSLPFASVGVLLLAACLIAIVSRRIGLPYSAGLVAAGLLIAVIPNGPRPELSRDLIFNVLLPPLVFEAAMQLEWKHFRRELPVTLLLAFAGVALAAAVVALGMHAFLGWSWIGAAMFGVLIAATDPVAVISAFREMRVQPRLSMLVESESLLNDGVAAVGFAVLIGIAAGQPATAASVVPAFLWTLLGGLLIGAAIAAAMLLIAGRTDDHLVEITLTTIAAFGSFLIAEHVHASGVIASLTAGLIIGNLGWMGSISDSGRGHMLSFWEYVAFLANSLVFLLIGVQLASQPVAQLASAASAAAIVLVLAGRAVAVYPLASLFARSGLRVSAPYQHILFWGGLRGALALALALAVPPTVPERDAIIIAAFVVVAFSVFVQGLTMPRLVRRLGLQRAGSLPEDQPTARRPE